MYTKGEWKVRETYNEPRRFIVDCSWKEGEQNWHRSICRMFGYCDTEQEELANAHLIAAAPQLYEALQMAKEVMEISEVLHAMEGQVGKEPYLKILQALAKAEGK